MNILSGKAALVLAGLALVTSLTGCGTQSDDGAPYETPAGSSQPRETHHFKSLRDMAQTSDLIVVGSVTDVKPGRTVGDGEGAIQFRDLSVTIEIVLKGPANIGQVKVEEEGFIKGQPYSLHGSKWANRGARAVFFLVKKVGEPGEPYRLTNSQSRFFLNNDRVVPNAADGHREEFETRLSGLTAQELIAEVRKAQ